MAKKIVNIRAKPGSGVKHNKHAPASKADIAAAENAAEETEIEVEETEEETPTMDNTKAEILEYCEANEIDVSSDWNKADLLDAIENADSE